jgi:hypothetical protein
MAVFSSVRPPGRGAFLAVYLRVVVTLWAARCALAFIGGKPATDPFKNWVVNINGECGGVFLDENHVLTVASCLVNKGIAGEPVLEPGKVTVHYQCLHSPGFAKDCNQRVKAQRVMLHPCYEGHGKGVHDVAVIWLNHSVPALSGAELPLLDGWNGTEGEFPTMDDGGVNLAIKDTLRFAGWGLTSYDVSSGEPNAAAGLYEGELTFVNSSFCKGAYANRNTSTYSTELDFDIPRKLCAGLGTDRFACENGDEGGPLFKTPDSSKPNQPVVVGLFSGQTPLQGAQRDRCNSAGRRGAFTRVAYYRGWIMETMITKASGFCEPAQRYRTPYDCPAGEWGGMDGCAKCPAGRYGKVNNLHSADCSGVCPKGYFCQEGSVDPTAKDCTDPSKFCRDGAPFEATTADGFYSIDLVGNAAPSRISVQWPNEHEPKTAQHFVNQKICEQGHYCTNGIKTPCPVGTYGLEYGLSRPECDSPCYAGFYCPLASVTPTKCQPGNWCDGNASIPCPSGRYGGGEELGSPECTGSCKEGHYCPGGSTKETEVECPGGTYGATRGLGSDSCSGMCLEGYFCPDASTRRNQNKCGAPELFCPSGSAEPLSVWAGYYSEGGNVDGTTRVRQTKCPKGSYCRFGVRFDCPPGTYGADMGMQINTCTGPAAKGFYTPRGSTSATQVPCPPGRYGTGGDIDAQCSGVCAKGHYCPANSTSATQIKCSAGRYGDSEGLRSAECSVDCVDGLCTVASQCTQGYYCPLGSVSSRERKCGNASVYCPVGSPLPVVAPPGYYTVNGETVIGQISAVVSDEETRGKILVCPKGHYCTGGVKIKCPRGTYGATKGLFTKECSGQVDPGHWSNEATMSARERKCQPGRYAGSPASTSAECEGPCLKGYYCPAGSISSSEKHCGSANVFCPVGSARPSRVSRGYYSVDTHGNNLTSSATTRTKQLQCPVGSYCTKGVRKVCPAGRYGGTMGLHSSKCSGPCLRGYYCPQESTYPGSHSSNPLVMKICPPGKYNSKLGGKSLSDCLDCTTGYQCLAGSVGPHGERTWH